EAPPLSPARKPAPLGRAGRHLYAGNPLPPDHPLRRLPNATLTPHLGYVTREMLSAFYADTVDAVVAWLDGTPVRVANPEALRRPGV
ncbi:MAG: D-2-hydroxyacid dehydrogenase family protein, partial [Mycobacterium sp.]|nr:D-2-hydroxyacid dehydrogenase family protein [Mycobacterium sp.]